MPNPNFPPECGKRRWLKSAIVAADAEKIDALPWANGFRPVVQHLTRALGHGNGPQILA